MAQDGWRLTFPNYGDITDPAVTLMEPRTGLFIYLLKWTGDEEDEFSLIKIIGEHPRDEDG